MQNPIILILLKFQRNPHAILMKSYEILTKSHELPMKSWSNSMKSHWILAFFVSVNHETLPTHHPSWIATSTATRHEGTHRGNRLLRASASHTQFQIDLTEAKPRSSSGRASSAAWPLPGWSGGGVCASTKRRRTWAWTPSPIRLPRPGPRGPWMRLSWMWKCWEIGEEL